MKFPLRVLSGMRPTGALHIGHWLGALDKWKAIQSTHECFFMVADLHALMSDYESPKNIAQFSEEIIIDWISCGIHPENIFIQSMIPEHAELALILGMLTPLGWLERNPTYKEQLREIKGRDLTTYGFLGYPVLQAADILLYKATHVPVGEDQVSHLELSREIVRRFKFFYKKEIFPEPEAILTQSARILGTDRRKMSKSYNNTINLSDSEETIRKKVQTMITDPARIKAQDPGHPEACNVYSYYKVFSDADTTRAVYDWCTNAKKGCTECKAIMADHLIKALKPIQERRKEFTGDPKKTRERVQEIIHEGQRRAQKMARQTLGEVKALLGLEFIKGS